jgi:coenzyme PQQ precursor peptide PqqA
MPPAIGPPTLCLDRSGSKADVMPSNFNVRLIPESHLDVSLGQKKTLNTWFWEVERGQHLPAPKNAENGQLTSDTWVRALRRGRERVIAPLDKAGRARQQWVAAKFQQFRLDLSYVTSYIVCDEVEEEMIMAWTTPTIVEICIGLEINGYLPPEFWAA